ncbi:MAG: von Willebrand factor type A domain-containing protein [Oscillospiraceae bacterium]|nr:von Willebrand factor type A domain-containing protein [Oscillospiraceae bacterium]
MKKQNQALALMTACILTACALTGCGSSDNRYYTSTQKGDTAQENYINAPEMQDNAAEMEAEGGRDLHYSADMEWYEEPNAEEYNAVTEAGFKNVLQNPLSTFSIDVDTASYSNIRRMLFNGEPVNPDAVRIEEMINYFSYDYPEPADDVPFSVNTEMYDCPWNEETQLFLVGLQAEKIDLSERKPMNLVFLIDVSGSMYSEDKLPLVQEAFAMLAENLNENDRISIVTYAGAEQVVLAGESGSNYPRIAESLYNLTAGGATAGAAGIVQAYELAEEYFIEGGNNRVVLATDGDLNVGLSTEEELTALIEEERETGVNLSVLGFGTGNLKDDRLEALADHGNGNYAYIDSLMEARKVLVQEMGGTLYTVAKDVKIQTEFNPEFVEGYRLIGYENRALANEDFADDKVDAGEIGAGHSVTALYELVLTDKAALAVNDMELKYQETDGTTPAETELMTISLRYKEPEGTESRLVEYPIPAEGSAGREMPDNLAFAAAVAEFGMLLRNSEYAGSSSYAQITELLEQTDMHDEYRQEFAELARLALDTERAWYE